tara:strand:- start:23 stop:226 length:204 start_codon:yes stop_codon:yes gene_type:complete
MRRKFLVFGLALLAGGFMAKGVADDAGKNAKAPHSLFQLKVKDIDGKAVALGKFRNQVLLVVNVASR